MDGYMVRAEPSPTPVCLKVPIGRFALGVVCPSFASDAVRAVATSDASVLCTVDEIVVEVTTG
jgi:hypothetical protein